MRKIKFTSIFLLIALALLMVSCPFGAEASEWGVDTTLTLNSYFGFRESNIVRGTFKALKGIKNSDKIEVYLQKQGEDKIFERYEEDIKLNFNGVQFLFDTKNINAYGKYRLICALNGEEKFFEFNVGIFTKEQFSSSLQYSSADLTTTKRENNQIEDIDEIQNTTGIIKDTITFMPNAYKGLLIKYNSNTDIKQLGSLALKENSIQKGVNVDSVKGNLLLMFDELTIKKREFDIEVYPQGATNFVKKIRIKLINDGAMEKIDLVDDNISELKTHSKSGVYFSITADSVRTSYNKNDFDKTYNVMQISIQRYNRLNNEWLNIGTIKEELTDEEKETNEQYFYLYKSNSTDWESIKDEHFSYTPENFKKFIYAKPIEMGYNLYIPYEGEYRIAVEVVSVDKIKSSGIKYINGNSLSNKATFTDEVSSFVVEGYSTNSLNANVNEIPFKYASVETNERDNIINNTLIARAEDSINEEWNDIEWTIPKDERNLHVYYTFDVPEFSENGGYLKYYEYFTKSGGNVSSYVFADGENTENATIKSEDWNSESNPNNIYEMHTRYHHYTSDIHDRTVYIKNVGDTVVKIIAENVGGGYGNIYNVNEISDDKLCKREFKIYNNEKIKKEMQGKVYTKERIEENDKIKFRFHFKSNPFAIGNSSDFDIMYFLTQNNTRIEPSEYTTEINTYEEGGTNYYYIDYNFGINDTYDMNKCTLISYIYPTKDRDNLDFVPYEECLVKLFVGNTISIRVDDEIQDEYNKRKYEIAITENGITDEGLKCFYAFSRNSTLNGDEKWEPILRQGDIFSKADYKTTVSKEYLYVKTVASSGAEVVVKKEIELRPLVGIITYPIWNYNNAYATPHETKYYNTNMEYNYDFVIKNSYWHPWAAWGYHDNDTNICAWVRKGVKTCIEMDYGELSHTVYGYSKTDVYNSEKDLTQIRYTIASKVWASTDGYPYRVFPIRIKALGYMWEIELNKGFLCHPYKGGTRGDNHNQYGQLPIQY